MSGYKVFQNGDILDANTDVNPFLMRQTVMVFDDAADRTAQLDGDELEGMVTYLKDVAHLQRYDGTDWVPAAGLVEIVTFTANGTFTKASYPWLRGVRVRVQAGGGGSAGSGANGAGQFGGGSGGAGGGYAESFVLATDLPASVPVTVGAGGAAGAPAGNGANGELSEFGDTGSYRTRALGGIGGFEASNRTDQIFRRGGDPGLSTHGQIQIRGGPGSSPLGTGNTFFITGGNGGDSQLGSGGIGGAGPGANAHSAGFVGNLYGGGGGGPCSRGNAGNTGGAQGAAGIVIVELYA